MGLFLKKPIEVEATQWFPKKEVEGVVYTMNDRRGNMVSRCDEMGNTKPVIKTLEGWYNVTPGDWIITGISGEKYPCKDDIFRKTYDPVDDVAKSELGEYNVE